MSALACFKSSSVSNSVVGKKYTTTYLHRQTDGEGTTISDVVRMFHGHTPLIRSQLLWVPNMLVIIVLHVRSVLVAEGMVLEVGGELGGRAWDWMSWRDRTGDATIGIGN